MVIVAYIGLVVIGAIIVYVVCRAIDHHFAMIEMGADSVYKAGLIETAVDDIQWLTEDMLKKLNDQWQNMFKGLGED